MWWKSYLNKMGYGERLGVDLPSEKKGFIPNSKFYNKVLKRNNWNAHNIISIAIGQGEILVTPVQIANFAAVAANRGYYYVPHVVRERKGPFRYTLYAKTLCGYRSLYFEIIAQGMANAVTGVLAALPISYPKLKFVEKPVLHKIRTAMITLFLWVLLPKIILVWLLRWL